MAKNIFSKDIINQVKKTLSSIDLDEEFEFVFDPLTLEQFKNTLEFLKKYSDDKKYKLVTEDYLDISYYYNNDTIHKKRISIKTIDLINQTMSSISNRNNNVIFALLVHKILSRDDNIEIIDKIKNMKKSFKIDEYNLRVNISDEKDISLKELSLLKELSNKTDARIGFRFKNRISVIIEDNANYELRIDISSTKNSNSINNIHNQLENYEMEIELKKKKKKINSEKVLKQIIDLVILLKKVLNSSNFIIPNSEKEFVLKEYEKIINRNKLMFYATSVKSLEIIHLIDYLPNNYTVTDKADGNRYLGIIVKNKLYYINSLLEVNYSGLEINKGAEKYNGSIIDGEHIFISKYNKMLFATFDILFFGKKDVRSEASLLKRLHYLDTLLLDCFGVKKTKYENFMNEDFNKVSKRNKMEIINYINNLDDEIKSSKSSNVISRKYFKFVNGLDNIEIFLYSLNLWNAYTQDSKANNPYLLDGLIFTPLNQIYTTNLQEVKYRTYKWKPPNKNTIDFFVKIEKNPDTGEITNVFDNTNDEIEDNIYQILNLYVGKSIRDKEVPVPFNSGINKSYVYTNDLILTDIENNIINDETVVEFYYDMTKPDSPFNWIPIKTRYDKTESIRKHNKKYGNNSFVSPLIWNSIQQDIKMDDIKLLTNSKTYNNEIEKLKSKITASYITSEKQQDIYYQKISKLAMPMRSYHNYIKSNMIYTYCSPKMIDNKFKKFKILDIGCGRGGDIQKFYHSKPLFCVGIDPDYAGLYGSASDGAISRYNNFKKKFPNFPNMTFIVANPGNLLNFEDQTKIIGQMKNENKNNLIKFFGDNNKSSQITKFNIFNCQFMIHFLFKNETTLNNFCDNINKYLEDNGYILITTVDGDKIHELFKKNNGVINSHYLNNNGKNVKFFEFKADYNYKENNINKTGLEYKSFLATHKEKDSYDNEFIVSKDFIKSTFKKKCNLELIESELFENIYYQQKQFFENFVKLDSNSNTKKYLSKVGEFYNLKDEVNKASFELSKLYRYYIFKKISKSKLGGSSNIIEI